MRSRKLLKELIGSLDLQATLTKKTEDSFLLKKIKENLIVEYYYFRKREQYPLPDDQPIIRAQNVIFPGEIPISLTLFFESEEIYHVIGPQRQKLGTGRLDTPFSTEKYSFTLSRVQDSSLTSETFFLTLSPLRNIAKALSKNIDIETDKDDPSLLILKYHHRNRHQASTILNQLMDTYQEYLKEEHHRISSEQIAYLHKREKEMANNLTEMIEEYANKIASEVSNVGYADSASAMEFLHSQMQESRQKLLAIDLELKRQERLNEENAPYDSRYQPDTDPNVLNELISDIRELRQKSDSIELALRNSTTNNNEEWEKTFLQQVTDLQEIRHCSDEAKVIIASLENNKYPLPSVHLLDNPKYVVKAWYDQLMQCERNWKNAPIRDRQTKKEEWGNFKSEFITYLTNLLHFLDVSEKTIQERLAHQQTPQFDFQGINLDTANELYVEYSKQLSEIEAQDLQLQFTINQLHNPEFEVSSLSTVIDDPVSIGMINKASEFVLALQDDANRSLKEKERFRKELLSQRRFFDIHLNQTVQLLHLREDLLKDKIQSLQNASLELIQQQISILERQLADCLETHIKNLQQERQLVEHLQLDLRNEMALLPPKWASEKLIEQQMKMNSAMVEELTKLVESKNITSNLETVQSAPVDFSLPPTHPLRPKLLFFAIIGGVLGAFFTMGGLLAKVILRGIPASSENLKLAGVHVSGELTADRTENLKTFRRLIAHLHTEAHDTPTERSAQSLAFIKGKGVDFSQDIAMLMSRKGFKVLILDLRFDKTPEKQQLPGLLQYLEGEEQEPQIHPCKFHDEIISGGVSPYSNEFIGSRAFQNLLGKLKTQYDWIIGITNATPESPEAENLLTHFDHAVINIRHETLTELNHIINLAKHSPAEKKVSFVKANVKANR